MTGKQLRNSILQWAIQGKLVPQDPNDEPASVLLERIRAEKARLVKEKKIKRDKNETIIYRGEDNSYYEKTLATGAVRCIDEEIPFDIPQGWEWVRLGVIFDHSSGKQQSSNNKSGGTPRKFITTSNLYWGRFELENIKVMNFTEDEIKTSSATKGDLLVCEGGAGYGRSAIWPFDYDICLQNHVHRLRPLIKGTCEYVYHFIYYLKETNQLASVGTAMPGLSANRLKGLLLPLPPLKEQQRIISRLSALEPFLKHYTELDLELDLLNQDVSVSLNKSILQEAIQGKLVPQIASEGTAEESLERIRSEKKRLVKEGKLKKSAIAKEGRIFRGDDNKYYEQIGKQIIEIEPLFNIPDSWSWVRLPQIAMTELGKTLDKGKDSGEITPYLCSINVYWTGIAMNTIKEAKFSQSERCKYKLQSGDLLICEGGDVGRCSIWTSNIDMWYQNALHRVRPFTGINVYYLKSLIEYYKGIGLIDKICKGVTIKHFTQNALCSLLIPLPPYKEQYRIIQKLEELQKMTL